MLINQTVHKYLNKRFYWDTTEQVLRYVTPDGLIQCDTGQHTVSAWKII